MKASKTRTKKNSKTGGPKETKVWRTFWKIWWIGFAVLAIGILIQGIFH